MLEILAQSIRKNKNIINKKEINSVVQFIDSNTFKNVQVYSNYGEDSAAINYDDKLILLTTDRINTFFIKKSPFGAGFSSILVSIDDIYACGGSPIAASIILSYKDKEIGNQILKGICEGSNKFKIPIIRGHTNLNENYYELSSTIIGEIPKEFYISACNAKIDDKIILAMDFEGKLGRASKYYFDTTTFKSSEEVLKKRESMIRVAKEKIVSTSKDVSNGGLFGTILQMIKYSRVGANININEIIIPPILKRLNYDLVKFSKMYLSTSFILTAQEKNSDKIINIFEKYGMKANIIGEIIKDKNLLKLNNNKNSIDVIKF
ncbi:MAG: hypothetical protein JXA99_11705 [Candidatus Lokiarchaeota archaeon]|nr:hypothetical protein [Candidatus Lokiarchaeota archaeon]